MHYTGWISPDGKFYPCEYFHHEETARELASKYYNSDKGSLALEPRGWIRLQDDGIVALFYGLITDSQIDILLSFLNDAEGTYKDELKWTLQHHIEQREYHRETDKL